MLILLKNAKVITPYQIYNNYSIVINNGKIINIGEDNNFRCDEYDKVINVRAKYVSPGFIDIHNHGNFGHDVMESTFEALSSISKFHINNGVTGFLATTMTASKEEIINAIKNTTAYIESKNNKNSIILGMYLEGPYFSQKKKGAQPSKHIKNPDINELKEFIEVSKGNVKAVALAPELPNALNIIEYLKSRDITVSVGHTNADYTTSVKAIERGVTQATHLYNGMRAFSHRDPGVVGAALTDERVKCEMICDGIHLHKAAMKIAVEVKGTDNIILISDAMMATGLDDGHYLLGGQDVVVKDNEARLSDGTLAGSTLTLNKAVYNMINLVGISIKDAVRMATLNPAKAIGIDNRKGSIEIGKDADLIVFDENIDIYTAIVNGEILNIK